MLAYKVYQLNDFSVRRTNMSQQAVLDFHPEPVERSLAKEASTARTLQEVSCIRRVCVVLPRTWQLCLQGVLDVQNFTSCHDTISDVAALLDKGDKVQAVLIALKHAG